MKHSSLKFVTIVISAVLLIGSINVFAADATKTIEAIFGKVKVTLDGVSTGKDTLLYEGRTYLQLKDTAEILGMNLTWDENTNTASLISKNSDVATIPFQSKLFDDFFASYANKKEMPIWDDMRTALSNEGYVYIEGEGVFSVEEPAQNGNYLGGVLTNESGIVTIASLSYHIGNLEREAEIEFGDGNKVNYYIDVTLNSKEPVSSFEELQIFLFGDKIEDSDENLKYKNSADFLNSAKGINFQVIAYKSAKAMLNADVNELAKYMINPKDAEQSVKGLKNVYEELEYMFLVWNLDSIKSEYVVQASYRYALKGEDSVSYVTMELKQVDNEWKINWIGIEK